MTLSSSKSTWQWWLTGGLVGVAGSLASAMVAVHGYEAQGPSSADVTVVVAKARVSAIADRLLQNNVIRSTLTFKIAVEATLLDGPLHAAEFTFPAHASLRQVLLILRFGSPVQHRITIPEGFTAAQVAGLLARTEGLTGDIVIPPEGWVLPETYAFERDTPGAILVQRAHAALGEVLRAAWNNRATQLPLRSPFQALVLASIVERETRRSAERPVVARVFLNRLAFGMPLQSDPTVIYAASGGLGTLERSLSRRDLDHIDDYNTYSIGGLSTGPICNPGAASIRAVLQPADGSQLYFVADGLGGHAFAETLADHIRNVRRLRASH